MHKISLCSRYYDVKIIHVNGNKESRNEDGKKNVIKRGNRKDSNMAS